MTRGFAAAAAPAGAWLRAPGAVAAVVPAGRGGRFADAVPRVRSRRGAGSDAPLRMAAAARLVRRSPGRRSSAAAGTALPLQDRLRTRARIRLESGHDDARQRALDELLDVAQVFVLVDAHERDRLAGRAGATGAPDPVHVIVGHVGEVVVDDVRQLVDVDAAGGDVGGDQHLQAGVLELGERARARALALVAVDGERGDSVVAELLGQLVGPVLGAREDEHLEPVLRPDQMRKQLALAVAIHRMHGLRDHFDGRIAPRDLDQRRRVEQVVGELADLVGKRRREQEVLPLLRQQREDSPDVADEAHVEHPVGFVEDENLDPREIEISFIIERQSVCDPSICAYPPL